MVIMCMIKMNQELSLWKQEDIFQNEIPQKGSRLLPPFHALQNKRAWIFNSNLQQLSKAETFVFVWRGVSFIKLNTFK